MRDRVRNHVGLATAILSAVSLALVFGAALQLLPTGFLPRFERLITAVPHVNAGVSLLAIVAILTGWWRIRRDDVDRHRRAMGTAVGCFVVFLTLYCYRVAIVGPSSVEGTGILATAYPVVLFVHVLLAVVCVPLVYYVALIGLTHPVPAVRRTAHARVGRVAASLWVTSFVLGIVVYLTVHVR